PFSGAKPSDCINSILKGDPPPLSRALPDVPVKLESVVQRALRKNRNERYQTIKEMLGDLRDLKAELETESSSPRAEPVVSDIKHHKRMALLTLVAGILVATGLAYHFRLLAKASSPNQKSIAVLPFADLSQARDQEYFCDGIQEEILTRLSKIADLKVISRTSTQRFKSGPKNLPEIAQQLGVANILEGTVQKAEAQIRVNVQLISARNDSYLWAERYDRKLTDVFGVESEIAKAIADTLQAKLTGSEQRAIATRPTQNADAHLLYLKGTFFSNKRTGSDLRTAIEYFKGAIDNDPNYALAYAGLADAYGLLALYGGEAPKETVPLAKAAARKALELDETSPEAHNSLGLLLALYDFDFIRSKSEFERAIELNPNYATAHHQFGNVNLSMIGEFDRAIAEGIRAVELDPLSLIINADLGQNFMLARRYDEAIEQLRKTLAMDPRFYYARWTLGECLQMKGQMSEAMTEYQKAAEITDDPMVIALLAQGYAKTGQRDKALGLLSQLENLAAQRYIGPFTFALVHLGLGENEKAIDDLERAYHERVDPGIVGIKVEPLLDPLRGHPRFERLVAEVVGSVGNKVINR
ncbi:MAG TPA: FlgO family outer membrane protein, partial [Candidatus Binatia bacterium]|nr:FlgO family outer membrane protein [Candidatus Binatia bacterium]